MVKISVVMPVYNTPVPFLKEAVDSILNQTFKDFEFIIIDDGSTDGSRQYLEELMDPRIRIIRNEINLGITKSLNIGFREAKGRYIARMDGDDVSLPKRFEKQLAFMESHPNAIACGAKTTMIGRQIAVSKGVMEDMESYRVRMLFANPGPTHSTAFFDREKLNHFHILYDEQLIYAQDYGMWMTISRYGDICILPEVLGLYRVHSNQISKAHRQNQIQCDQMTQRKLLIQLLDEVTDEELEFHYHYSTGYNTDAGICSEAIAWFDRLMAANAEKRIYDRRKFNRFVYTVVYKRLICNSLPNNASIGKKIKAFFHWMPFSAAVHTVAGMSIQKCKSIIRAKPKTGEEERIPE